MNTNQTTKPYGKELILDLHKCDPSTFNRDSLEEYFIQICDLIKMKRCTLHFWDDLHIPPEEKQTDEERDQKQYSRW